MTCDHSSKRTFDSRRPVASAKRAICRRWCGNSANSRWACSRVNQVKRLPPSGNLRIGGTASIQPSRCAWCRITDSAAMWRFTVAPTTPVDNLASIKPEMRSRPIARSGSPRNWLVSQRRRCLTVSSERRCWFSLSQWTTAASQFTAGCSPSFFCRQ
ncbi:hypothetical protein BKK80_00920 [Cupriavidus malaysiensis]|uniref:Uncharacterized protein n=1 Tax=Cupriavidus malaysiensis TaxID=367825 RepID=A0ABN4TBP8_9BURK|nr:hypothetical protein BKK80_00920 [Cupriavidus malaysiensis]